MSAPDSLPTEVELTFDRLGARGDAVADFEGKPLYVSDVVPGERALVRIRKRYRSVAVGEVVRIVEPSPHRVEPPCPLFYGCSGCQLQHIDYPRQLELKRDLVQAALADAGLQAGDVAETLAAPDPWYYRNHGRFTVEEGRLGFVRQRPRQFFPVDRCLIMRPEINALLERLQGRLVHATQCNIRVGTDPDQVMIQPRLTDVSMPSGQASFQETLHGHRFRVSAGSFFQVNTPQAERLLAAVVAEARPTHGGTVVDAYAGVGTFACALAAPGTRVIAIEESEAAMADARENLLDQPSVELLLGKAEKVLAELTGPVATVIIDPPRSGCRPAALRAIVALRPPRVVYVSCDLDSLMRDLRLLVGQGYAVSRVQPVDMFPQTRHVEVVVTLDDGRGAVAAPPAGGHPPPSPS